VRWIETRPDENGRARLKGLRPGRYRVALRFAPEGARGPLRRAPVEITLTAGREHHLPPFRLSAPRTRK
jgi:hypothetical protein